MFMFTVNVYVVYLDLIREMEKEKFLSKLLLNLNYFVGNKLGNNLEDDWLIKPENLLEIDYYISM